MDDNVKLEISKATPGIAVSSANPIFGISIPDWVSIITIVYLLLQIATLVLREVRRWRQRGS